MTLHINVAKGYDVAIESGLIGKCGSLVREAAGDCRVAIVTDRNVERLYLTSVCESLRAEGYLPVTFSFPAGERSKNISTLAQILDFLAKEGLTRGDCVIALGGGVVGDVAGFAAGCFLRGIRYLQIPTTLLAAVDSSVGGKTAIDLAAGKNLAGLFLQPSGVICDTDCIATLPGDRFADGAAEAIKTGVLGDEELFGIFEAEKAAEQLEQVITRCVAYKGRIVEQDERESGTRKQLNLGHTIGHAVEKCSEYAVSHGQAVAIGLAMIARAAEKKGYCNRTCVHRIVDTLRAAGLATQTAFSPRELTAAALSDKKREGDKITLVVPRKIGDCVLKKINITELQGWITAGMEDS